MADLNLTVTEQEKQMREAQVLLGASALATSVEQSKEEQPWKLVKGSKHNPEELGPQPVPIKNRFVVLEEGKSGGTNVGVPVEEKRQMPKEGKVEKNEPEVLIVKDSQVRYLERTFCERQRARRLRVCLPEARVQAGKNSEGVRGGGNSGGARWGERCGQEAP